MIGKYKDPRDVNSQQRKAKRNEFLNVLTKEELSQMIQAGKNPFNTDHTINISNTDSWLSSKNFAAMMKKNQQNNWDDWANARQSYWSKREVLTHNEFIYLLKGKEPRSLEVKPTQFDYFPLEFCAFHDETVRIIEDYRVLRKIIPVYEDGSNHLKVGFKAVDLIKLALSKNIHVPSWLIPKINNSDEKIKNNSLNEYSIDSYALSDYQDCTLSNELSVWDVILNLAIETKRSPSKVIKQVGYSALQWVQAVNDYYPDNGDRLIYTEDIRNLKARMIKDNFDFLEISFSLKLADEVEDLLFSLLKDRERECFFESEIGLLKSISVNRDCFGEWIERKGVLLPVFWFADISSTTLNTLNGMDDRLKRKQKLPKEPVSLNLVYKPGKSFKQQKWDEIPAVDQKHWKHRDTLTIIELAFILKGKEPLPQATQYNILNLYPLGFCEFVGKLLEQADSSWKIGKLIEINLPAPYGEEWADPSEFERKELIKWTKSKQYEVPAWLTSTAISNHKTHSLLNGGNVQVSQRGNGFDTRNKKIGINQQRTQDFNKWLEDDSVDLDELIKDDIEKLLIVRNDSLWSTGFEDWWQDFCPIKKTPGRPKKKK